MCAVLTKLWGGYLLYSRFHRLKKWHQESLNYLFNILYQVVFLNLAFLFSLFVFDSERFYFLTQRNEDRAWTNQWFLIRPHIGITGKCKTKITETVESEHLRIGPEHLYDFDSDTICSLNLFIMSILFGSVYLLISYFLISLEK